jgi:hypothetical protein
VIANKSNTRQPSAAALTPSSLLASKAKRWRQKQNPAYAGLFVSISIIAAMGKFHANFLVMHREETSRFQMGHHTHISGCEDEVADMMGACR